MENLIKIDNMIKQNELDKALSKVDDMQMYQFKTIDKKFLREIESWIALVNQKVGAFQKKNSQTTSSLMSLNMVDAGPYRVLRQILAQSERKKIALKEAIYNIEEKTIKYKYLEERLKKSELEELQQKKILQDIIDSKGPIEAALKELCALKKRYEEICRNKNISNNWDENDFEKAEIEHHIKSIFRNALRDRIKGTCNSGTMEYMEQFGINPIMAYALADDYINQVRREISKGDKFATIDLHYEFYDKMYKLFKNEYKKAMKRLGLDSIVHADFLMKEN